MLAFCLATILLSVTAATMWWKRRPAGGLGVPPWPRDRRVAATVTAIVVGLGALFPLTGLAILAMLGLDRALGRVLRDADGLTDPRRARLPCPRRCPRQDGRANSASA